MSDSDDSDFFVDDSPKKKAPSKKPAGDKKAPAKPKEPKDKKDKIADISMTMTEEDKNVFTNIDQAATKGKKLAIEDIYQKKSQLEHILLRPDTYIGEKNQVSIFNNGKGIPVVHHKVENMYVPEMIFGTLLTSSNYDDSERKVTGGRNGYGAKLCNIFSTEFTLETSSKEYGKAFKQTWINNMTKDKEPQIVKATSDDYTKITFKPDLKKFKMSQLDDDIIGLMSRRAYDIAGSTKGVKVFLNGKALPVQGFKQYVEQYTKDLTGPTGEPAKVVYESVKNHMWVFVNCLIENPTFDSQTKETMTLQSKSFGSKCELSEKFTKQAVTCGVVDAVLAWVRFKQQEDMNKKCSGKKATKLKGIPKLEDANDAGTKNSQLCTLILTEGDSAKTLAVSGLGVVGRDRYGVFPLRGKLLNVREGNIKQVAENVEVNALIKILGLQYKKKYETEEDFKSLRYGKVMVMADQDQDGSHIKGLVINFIHHNWPSLIQRNFVEEFITPIVKATKGKEELSFFSIPEYNEWRNNTENWKSYKIKYYKGLGTSTSKEAKEYFSDMVRHRIKFKYGGVEDDNAVDMAFSKKKIEERKDWLTKWMAEKKERRARGLEEEYLYNKDTRAELVLFSNTDNERSIPSLVDGFKPGQRKVMFACFKRADKREVKVAQLAGAVGELSAYHHGEMSLMGIGTGWSTSIPNYNPREICENMRKLIRGEQPKPLAPWFKHFRGTIEQLDSSRYVCSGEVAVLSDDTIEITELPIKTWTQTYKETVLEPMLESNDKKPAMISDFKEYHTDVTVRFVVKLPHGKLRELEAEGLHKVFKLQTVLNTTSMARFILAKIKGEIVMENKKKQNIVEQLIKKGFDPDPVKKWKELQKKKELEESGEYDMEEEEEENEESGQDKDLDTKLSDYDYLVGMALIKLSEEEKNKLLKESDDKMKELRDLESKTWADLWNADLDTFLEALEKQEAKEKADLESCIKNAAKKFAKEEKPSKGAKRTAAFAAEVFPSKDGIRIEPGIDKSLKEKYDKIKAAATREKKPKEPKPPKEPKKPKVEGDDIKKFLKSEKKSPKKKRADTWESDVSSSELSGVDDAEENTLFDDDDDVEEVIPKKDRASRGPPKRYTEEGEEMTNGNAAGDAGSDVVMLDDDDEVSPVKSEPVKKSAPKKKKIVESDESFSESPPAKKTAMRASPVKKPPAKKKNLAAGDISDSESTSKRSKKTSDDYDVFEIPDDDDEKPAAKKKAPAKKTAAPAKKEKAPAKAKKENGTTDSPKMTDFFGKKSKPKKKGDDTESDDEVVIDDNSPPPAPRQISRRPRPAAKYNYGGTDDEDEDEDFPQRKKKRLIDSDSD
ncbi:DNA gyrase/topoisomerase IV, A subunit [Teladorsagia circumcincta]|uniref:DNA topoisomerase 2 n=1 Tax=Teladorsagia circumcincta TaxID=45464 RepID=A0A2G9UWV7_TELCI|nr:DNA gyrase/topoisomerase IV, A subunit [Teladorsagia circumcincta]